VIYTLINVLFSYQEQQEYTTSGKWIVLGFSIIAGILILYKWLETIEFSYAHYFNKPFFNHVYFTLKKLTKAQRHILKTQFKFYNTLSKKHQAYFEHRVKKFINAKTYIAKEDLEITDQMRVLVGATATMLTFGYRNYSLNIIERVVIYPEPFFSRTNKEYHKGEFNPMVNAIVFSWKDFLEGYQIDNDNLNLGIHELVHAIHLEAIQENDITATIFLNTFNQLTEFLEKDEAYKLRLVQSDYIRDYAFTNHFEFIAVLIESFIETPQEFKNHFPEVYIKVKQMLNFNFQGY